MKIKRVLFIFIFIVILINFINAAPRAEIKACGDGTFYNTCSLTKPYFCNEGILVENSDLCRCPNSMIKKEDSCYSSLQTTSKEILLKYTLNGEEKSIKFTAYEGMNNYLSGVSRTIQYSENQISSRADFKLKGMDEEKQKSFLMPLVVAIQNEAPNSKEDQARIAISIVQNIPFKNSNKTISFGDKTINYFRHPYEVIYDNEGVCGEKVELLGFLLREIGYGTAFFYHPTENHESLGIKCPMKQSLGGTGYCFVETTSPSIITESEIRYVNIGKLSDSFQVFLLSDGISLPNKMPEYTDAKKMGRIRESLEKRNGKLNFFLYLMNKKLQKKYGLDGEFNI